MMINNVVDAVALLRDPNLVWSADMEGIKDNLADLLITAAAQGDFVLEVANNLAVKIISAEQLNVAVAEFKPALERR